MYGFVRNRPIHSIDVLGQGELWTISGIESVNKQGDLDDYVARHLRSEGYNVNRDEHSDLGTGKKFIYPGGPGFVGYPWSESVLDSEARKRAKHCCKTEGSLCGKKICVVMIAPKTDTKMPESPCCNIEIKTWYNPYDWVPNQGVGNSPEFQKHWGQYGDAYPVDSQPKDGNSTHTYEDYMDSNPMYDPDWQPNPLDGPQSWPKSGKTAPNPMDVIKDFTGRCDITIVCHSQGCNIALETIKRGCTK